MSYSLIFYVLMLLWLVLGIWGSFPFNSANAKPLGSNILLFILLLLLGAKVFGPPIHS